MQGIRKFVVTGFMMMAGAAAVKAAQGDWFAGLFGAACCILGSIADVSLASEAEAKQ